MNLERAQPFIKKSFDLPTLKLLRSFLKITSDFNKS